MWHPYYAGYSESFVLSVLSEEKLAPNAVVLDPWMGSGTTGLVCQKQNINCIGADINPIMSRFAAAKNNMIISELNCNGLDVLDEIINRYTHESRKLSKRIKNSQVATAHLKKLYESINNQFDHLSSSHEMNPLESFYYGVLFFTSRKSLEINSGSNPTWVIDKEFKNKSIKVDLIGDFKSNFYLMREQLNNYFENINTNSTYKIFNSDCKSLPIDNASIDMVITSPPYLTRIDYAASTKFELQLTFGQEGYESIRKKSMGTTTVPKDADPFNSQWGDICSKVLEQVMTHTSRASDTYYIKNKLRYFSDAYSSLREIYRVLKDGMSAYLVLQNSYYKEIEIPLYDIYCEMALNIGYSSSKVVKEEKVRVSLGQINPKSSVYLKDKVYYEKIIKVTK
ncbi:putative methyltransferase [Serratia quinivorans]|nr:DNA methyltransferase [Serratia quinivorans]CAI1899452.1 putative methyltransferase [Serratia quinivorans]CAI1988258.1 putative methyltransferase [Serratia quinivorans]CAI2146954.1 putative methyltransferase [Serratia quinivorans]CAI2397987.1 putative methyltransferase [Serratia quinivorans]